MSRIAILGSGAWGTALAQHLAGQNQEVTLWGRDQDVLEEIKEKRQNTRYLPAVALSPKIAVNDDLKKTVLSSDIVLAVTPAQTIPDLWQSIQQDVGDKPIVLCAKGILVDSGKLLPEIFPQNARLGALTGPTFAREVAMGLPTAATLACADEKLGQDLVQTLSGPMFRLYWSRDIIGAEAAGALKNVLAIACGIVDGLGLGDNARAALITRGMAEIGRYVRWKGGQAETLMGLCGLGDIVLTCASHQSRNYSLGVALGQGQTIDTLMTARTSVAEGVPTAMAIGKQSKEHGLDMPICQGIAAIVTGKAEVQQIVSELLQRPLRGGEEGL